MKPTPGIGEKGTNTVSMKATAKSRMLVYVVVGLVISLLIAGAIVGTFFLGLKASKDNYKEAWMTFKMQTNNTVIKERVIVQEKEVEVIRPGVLKAVFDYKKNLLVMQYDQALNGDEPILCYVYEFEPGMFGSEVETKTAIQEEATVVDVKEELSFDFETTGEEVPSDSLSPKAKDMCFGAKILKVRQQDSHGHIHKRAAPGGCCCCCCCCADLSVA